MSFALDQFERSLVAASRALHALEQSAPTQTESANATRRPPATRRPRGRSFRPRRLMISLSRSSPPPAASPRRGPCSGPPSGWPTARSTAS